MAVTGRGGSMIGEHYYTCSLSTDNSTDKLLLGGARTVLQPPSLFQTVCTASVLLVGAGGIGCELLHSLVATGFTRITVIDLDTVELSNLNRQFLFTRSDIGSYKAATACAAILKRFANVTLALCPMVADVRSLKVDFFRQFDVVLGALDNLEARRHVNLMAVMVGIPVVESGTAGYSGQCGVWLPPDSGSGSTTECFDCRHHSVPTTFPICTIRATPEKMIHCIVWAKDYLLSRLFREAVSDDVEADIEDQTVSEALRVEAEAFNEIQSCPDPSEFADKLFYKLFVDDIHKLLQLEDLWKDRPAKPHPLHDHADKEYDDSYLHFDKMSTWSVSQWAACFHQSAKALRLRSPTSGPAIVFDKDDDGVMAFVAAAANLRAFAFSCTPATVSLFTAKEMAGNIIPAVATTNAIVAGVATSLAVNILRKAECVANVFVCHGAKWRVLSRERLEPGAEECSVCRTHRFFLFAPSLELSIADVLRALGIGIAGDDDIQVLFNGRLLYDSVDDAIADRSIEQFGVSFGDVLTIIHNDRRPILAAVLRGDRMEGTCTHTTDDARAGNGTTDACILGKRLLVDDDYNHDDGGKDENRANKIIKISDDIDDGLIVGPS